MEASVESVIGQAARESFFSPGLWVVAYDSRAVGKGIATVKAPDAEEAGQILTADGMYNGTRSEYLVTRTEEIVIPPCCGLTAEQNVEFFNNN